MSIESIVRSEFEQVAREQEKVLSGLSDDTVLLEFGPGFAVLRHHRGAAGRPAGR